MESAFDLDDILEEVGGWRRWHIAIFFILGLGQNLPYCSTGLIIVFTGNIYYYAALVSQYSSIVIHKFTCTCWKLYNLTGISSYNYILYSNHGDTIPGPTDPK